LECERHFLPENTSHAISSKIKELKHYAKLDLGSKDLFDLYRKMGFQFRHIEWDDPADPPDLQRATYAMELERARVAALEAFDGLPKPILLHCSAGIDRSFPVAAYVFQMRCNAADTELFRI